MLEWKIARLTDLIAMERHADIKMPLHLMNDAHDQLAKELGFSLSEREGDKKFEKTIHSILDYLDQKISYDRMVQLIQTQQLVNQREN